ncbi:MULTISPECIES: hypothetical protein [Bosea]|uniref:Preprotein translocase subunit SecE n=1 Tax=Bosea rubneri TaxID=3075434 RepID=A0ABU3SBA8_9HYPH|nr:MULTISPECIES: hypothetical protein [unclassified Bosea (in: a-proteobacteria)]MDU0342080.1 hypothetical protein [Bosea sp. ZW T0_25]HEV7335145.1 hypothetical protein [Bosea sp. (in: a-proteobacteria)]
MNRPSPAEPRQPAIGPLRRFLRLIVEVDESRLWLHRVRAALILLGLLAAFGLLGYWLPALLERAFR